MSIKQKIVAYILMVAIIIGGVIYGIILPTLQDIQKINDGVLAERIDLEKKYLRGQLLKTTIENFKKIKPQEDKLDQIYIGQNEELRFITALEDIANRNGLEQDIKLAGEIKSDTANYEPLALEIITEGGYIGILQYLKDIERLTFYFNISNITVNTTGKQKIFSSPITLTIKGQIFKSTFVKSDEKNNTPQ